MNKLEDDGRTFCLSHLNQTNQIPSLSVEAVGNSSGLPMASTQLHSGCSSASFPIKEICSRHTDRLKRFKLELFQDERIQT